MSIQSYQKAISLFTESSITEEDKREVERELKELTQMYNVGNDSYLLNRNISRSMAICKDEPMWWNIWKISPK